MKPHTNSTAPLTLTLTLMLGAVSAHAQDEPEEPVDVDKLFEPAQEDAAAEPPAAEAAAAPATEAPPAPEGTEAEAEAASPTPAPTAVVQDTAAARGDERTIGERGGLFGLGLVVAPKLGGGLGSVFLSGAGGTFVGELEVGYDLPLALPVGRDLEVFASLGYTAPSATETVPAGDARLPEDGAFEYTLTLHQLVGTYGVLYRLPIHAVPWWRLYVAAGARTIWSNTVITGASAGQAFGEYQETAFDLGAYGAVGSDFYVGPGAVLVELQAAASWPDRFVLRATSTTALQMALGYRFFL